MTPQEILLKHEDLLMLVIEHGYIPNKDQDNFGQVKKALQDIDNIERTTSCNGGCMFEIIRMAKVHLDIYKQSLIKLPSDVNEARYHTFPAVKEKRKRGPNKKK